MLYQNQIITIHRRTTDNRINSINDPTRDRGDKLRVASFSFTIHTLSLPVRGDCRDLAGSMDYFSGQPVFCTWMSMTWARARPSIPREASISTTTSPTPSRSSTPSSTPWATISSVSRGIIRAAPRLPARACRTRCGWLMRSRKTAAPSRRWSALRVTMGSVVDVAFRLLSRTVSRVRKGGRRFLRPHHDCI